MEFFQRSLFSSSTKRRSVGKRVQK